jgi:hypothetical protein
MTCYRKRGKGKRKLNFDHTSHLCKEFEFGLYSRHLVELVAVRLKTSAATQTPAADRGLLWVAGGLFFGGRCFGGLPNASALGGSHMIRATSFLSHPISVYLNISNKRHPISLAILSLALPSHP